MGLLSNLTSLANTSDSNSSEHVLSTANVVIKTLVFVTTITSTLIGNGLIYAAMVRFRYLRTPTNMVLVSLATTDLGMVVIMVLHAVTELSGEWIFGRVLCHVFATLGLVLSFISILHLCFLSIDRFVAIHKPLRYRTLITRRRVCTVLVCMWIFPSSIANLPWSNYEFRSQVYGCEVPTHQQDGKSLFKPFIFVLILIFVVIPFGIMLYLHASVFKVALSHARSLSAIERSIRRSGNGDSVNTRQHRAVEIYSMKREIKSAKTFALVIGVFLCCYIPFFTAGTFRKFAGVKAVPDVVMFITTWVAFANSFCNPLVYSLRYSPLKKAFRKLLHCDRRKRYAFKVSLSSFHISIREKSAKKLEEGAQSNTTVYNTAL